MYKQRLRIRPILIDLSLYLLSAVLILAPVPCHAEVSAGGRQVQISFDYAHQSTIASNQIALWIEDEQGQVVKTLLATSFTAGRRGYRNRDMSLNHWVNAAQPESLSQDALDAISSATPSSGHLEYIWDLTDQDGLSVPEGRYRICLEGTLYWESNILYAAIFDTAEASGTVLAVESTRSQPDHPDNETMLQNVNITIIN